MLYSIGRVCVKLAGRDAGTHCVIVDVLDATYVLIEGESRRRKCNVLHLEPTRKTVDIAKGADSATVIAALKKIDIIVKSHKGKVKIATKRPVKEHKQNKK